MNNKTKFILYENDNQFSYEKNNKNIQIRFNRVAFIFFVFFIISLIYLIHLIHLGSRSANYTNDNNSKIYNKLKRADIVDRNGNFLAKTVSSIDIGINPIEIIDQKKLLLNLSIIFPNKDYQSIQSKFNRNKFFWFEKKISEQNFEKIMMLGDKSIKPEEKLIRVYPQKNLFSHIIGQIDNENNGISGLEKSFDKNLKDLNQNLKLTVDLNLQYLIREELIKFQKIFNSIGSAAILMDSKNGEILSLLSLPDYDLNKRQLLEDKNLINRATKGVYELGSVFKTFTYAAGLNEGVIDPDTEFINLEKKIYCSKFPIGEYDNKIPSDLTAEQILIRSGNIGSVRIGQKVGIERFKFFLENIGVLNKIEFDIEEVGQPIPFRWGKCKLATSSFGHGITTTPLQLAKGYAIITNGGYDIKPTLIKKNYLETKVKNKILDDSVSKKINPILRKIVSTKEGTAEFANISGYEVGGKTGTAQKSIDGIYSKDKVNTFVAVFPTSNPKFVLTVLLDEPKPNKEYVYNYRDGRNPYKGNRKVYVCMGNS